LRLETISELFYDTFLSNKAVKIDRMVIAALSQGGLVVRSALNRCGLKDEGNIGFRNFILEISEVDASAIIYYMCADRLC
jgi:hypothetical protein